VFLFVLVAALPQLLILRGSKVWVQNVFDQVSRSPLWPWTATSQLAQGHPSWVAWPVMIGWTLIAYLFGRWQFERGLTFDAAEAGATPEPRTPGRKGRGWLESFYQLPNRFLRDPVAAIIEKELRFLTRSPRFRLVFVMGFSFGLLIWLPVTFGRGGLTDSAISRNYLTWVSVYALILLSDVLFWNVFGFDRSAAQVYFLVPVKLSRILFGKNLTAVFFVLIEVTAITIVCALLRFPINAQKLVEAYSVTVIVALYMLAIGNLSSIHNPRPVNPAKSFRSAAGGRAQAMLMLLFPLACIPVALAYLARYAFAREIAFFGVLLFSGILGVLVYWIAMDSAVEAAERRKEQMITALSQGAGPITD
jgi:ABC-2 type transport system permease protein